VTLDLIDHLVIGAATDGRVERFPMEPMSVVDFHARFLHLIRALGGTPELHGSPNEVADPVPFARDRLPRPYDAQAVTRFFWALVQVDGVLKRFRTGFVAKVSPVHLFWGSFDIAVTRFSGRPAPRHPGGIPALPDAVTREAYSHEVSSAGFWPGGGAIDYPAFYSYVYPAPAAFAQARVVPDQAFYSAQLGEYLLPYDVVRQARDPEATIMAFLQRPTTRQQTSVTGIARRSNVSSESRAGHGRCERSTRDLPDHHAELRTTRCPSRMSLQADKSRPEAHPGYGQFTARS
jgi:Family of unknown function (DUF5996)